MGDFFQLVLNCDLELQNLLGVVWVLDLLHNLGGVLVHGSLEQTLGVVKLVAVNVWEELCKLVVAICRVSVVLDLEITETEERKSSSVSWRELELVAQDVDNLVMLLLSDQGVDGLGVLAVWYSSKLVVHFYEFN